MSKYSGMNLDSLLTFQQGLINRLVSGGKSPGLAAAPRRVSGREIAAKALTGRLRADAGLLRQAAANAQIGTGLARTLLAAAQSISASLRTMNAVAAKIDDGSAVQADYEAYGAAHTSIGQTVKNTAYHGMSLMNAAGWERDSRLTANGSGAGFSVQLGSSSKNVSLTDFSSFFAGMPTLGTLLSDKANDAGQFENDKMNLRQLQGSFSQYESGYKALADSFAAESKNLARQAGLAELSAKRQISGARDDPAGRLAYRILNEQGKIINKLS